VQHLADVIAESTLARDLEEHRYLVRDIERTQRRLAAYDAGILRYRLAQEEAVWASLQQTFALMTVAIESHRRMLP